MSHNSDIDRTIQDRAYFNSLMFNCNKYRKDINSNTLVAGGGSKSMQVFTNSMRQANRYAKQVRADNY